MEVYLKAGPDQTSAGDCPFAHYVRMVLEEKKLEYDVKPCVQETKPNWLIEHYDGKMPALRHRKECYVESDVIAAYLEFFFPSPSLTCNDKNMIRLAEDSMDGLFPAIAKYIKHTPDGDEMDNELLQNLKDSLMKLNDHFVNNVIPTLTTKDTESELNEYYLTGSDVTLLDCSLAPKLYTMKVAVAEYKKQDLEIPMKVQAYMDTMFRRESFQKTVYPPEYAVWGWGNARK
jgi:glutathione S-transferase